MIGFRKGDGLLETSRASVGKLSEISAAMIQFRTLG